MARKVRWLGLLATYRELNPREREAVDRALEDDSQGRELQRLFAEQHALLASLEPPCISPAVTERVMAATVARGDGAFRPRWRPVLAAVLSLVLLVLVGGTGMAFSGSLPGDALYPVKRAGEEVRMALILCDQGRAHYAERLGEIRRQEVNALLGLGRAGIAVEFEGPLEHSPSGDWLVAGVPILLPEDTGETPQMVAGSPVYIIGEIGQTQVRVQTMRPLTSSAVPAGPPTEPGSARGESVPAAPRRTPGPASEPTAKPRQGGDEPQADGATPALTATVTEDRGRSTPKDAPAGQGQPSQSTPPGLGKDRRSPASPEPKGDGDTGKADMAPESEEPQPPAKGPAAPPRDGTDKPPDGHPQPTGRPPHTRPPSQRHPQVKPSVESAAPGSSAGTPDGLTAAGSPSTTPSPSNDATPRGRQ